MLCHSTTNAVFPVRYSRSETLNRLRAQIRALQAKCDMLEAEESACRRDDNPHTGAAAIEAETPEALCY